MVFERPYNDLTLPEPDPHPDYARSSLWFTDPDCRQPDDGQGESDYLYTFDNVASDTQGLFVLLNQSELAVILVQDMVLESPVVVDYPDNNDMSQILKAYDGQSIIGISHDGRHLEINTNRELTFQNVQLKGNNPDAYTATQQGGGIRVGDSYWVTLTGENDTPDFINISDCFQPSGGAIESYGYLTLNENFNIANCRATNGGALYATDHGELNIVGINFTHNAAANKGGALYVSVPLNLVGGNFTGNRADGEGGQGGALYVTDIDPLIISPDNIIQKLDIRDATISQNAATREGGAIYITNCFGTLSSCTLNDNHLDSSNPDTHGGAIYVSGASNITLSNYCHIEECTAAYGGAVYLAIADSHLTIKDDTTLTNNVASQQGGGVMVMGGTLNLINANLVMNIALSGGGVALNNETSSLHVYTTSLFNGNAAYSSDPDFGYGGGIYAPGGNVVFHDTATFLGCIGQTRGGCLYLGSASATINDAYMEFGTAEFEGGAIYVSEGTLTITDATFKEGYAEAGGAIFLYKGTATVQHATFLRNTAIMGGAVFLQSDTARYHQSTGAMTGNTAFEGEGGAIYLQDGTLILDAVDFTGNSALNGGAIYSPVANLTIGVDSTFQDNVATSKANKISDDDQALYDSNIEATVWTLFDQGLNNYDINNLNYTITLDPNGGTGDPVETYLLPGETYQIPECPFEKNNCSFTRWNTMSDRSGQPYTDEEITPTESLTLYAQWKCPICCPPGAPGIQGPQGEQGPKGQDAQLFIASALIEPGIYEDGADLMDPIELPAGLYFVQYWVALSGTEHEENRILISLNDQLTATHTVDEHLTGTHLVQGPTTLTLQNATAAPIKIHHGALLVFG